MMFSSLFILPAFAAVLVAQTSPPAFQWLSITPSSDLEYHNCFDRFQCARLLVPRNWLNTSDDKTFAIAITKLPAVVPEHDPTYGGPILMNPGGPGDSGTALVEQFGVDYQSLFFDIPGKRHYDVISFDPRGIGETTPVSNCLQGNVLARNGFLFEMRGNGGLERSRNAISYGLSLTHAYNNICKQTELEFGEAMSFVNTPSVARDMVQMIDKIQELSLKQAAHTRTASRQSATVNHAPAKLNYYGISYGTILGAYFTSLFPSRVGRVVFYGVANASDYATGPGWTSNTVDADKVFDALWADCFKAGPSVCSLARSEGNPDQAKDSFWTWVSRLDATPLPVISPTGSVMVLTGDDVRLVIGTNMFQPLVTFLPLADALNQAMSGNTTALANTIANGGQIPLVQNSCPVSDTPPSDLLNIDGRSAILSGDGDDNTNHDATFWQQYVDFQVKQSKIMGSFWSTVRFACSGWPFKPNWTFKGPFTSPKSSPPLLLSNRLDVVTPLGGARYMLQGYPGASIVIQESVGHTVSLNGPSQCTRRIVQEYFATGKLPKNGTVCQPDCGPFDPGCNVFSNTTGTTHRRSITSPFKHKKPFPMKIFG